jgi:hypothetical protein
MSPTPAVDPYLNGSALEAIYFEKGIARAGPAGPTHETQIMTTPVLEDLKVPVKLKLSALWASVIRD